MGKVKHEILQQNLSKCYRFESADTLCEQLNKFINTLKKERKNARKNTDGKIQMRKEKTCQIGRY